VPTFLYHINERLSSFSDTKNGWWGRLLVLEILKFTSFKQQRRFSIDIRS